MGMTPSKLAVLIVAQDVAFAVAGPFWASLADNGVSRRLLLSSGAIAWGLLTMILAFVSEFYFMVVLRALNGACLGLILPITQAVVAEDSPLSERGYSFGLVEFSNKALGQMFSAVVVTSISNKEVFGFEGFRVAFFGVALLSLAVGSVVHLWMVDKPRPWTPENIGVTVELKKFLSYLRIPTFLVVVVQGMFGTIPGAALNFATMYFQYLGMPDFQAASTFAMYVLGGGCGSLVGGIIGDRLAAHTEDHGRPLTAQVSVILGIPLAYLAFTMRPSVDSLFTIGGVMFMLGLFSSWCAAGCNKPIFLQIVPASSQASAVAWEFCVEHTSGHLIGPLAVGFISQHFFNYTPTTAQIPSMDPVIRMRNADALGKSLTLSTIIPWSICFLLFGFLHFTYKHDVRPMDLLDKQTDVGQDSERESTPNYATA